VSDEEKIERVARQLCIAAGKNPDARIRLGQPLAFAAGECTVIRPLIVPTWKQYCREARRLAMSDAEHAELSPETTSVRKASSRLNRALRSARAISMRLRHRSGRVRFAQRLNGLCAAVESGALARAKEIGSRI
jgi:hypothetical protein